MQYTIILHSTSTDNNSCTVPIMSILTSELSVTSVDTFVCPLLSLPSRCLMVEFVLDYWLICKTFIAPPLPHLTAISYIFSISSSPSFRHAFCTFLLLSNSDPEANDILPVKQGCHVPCTHFHTSASLTAVELPGRVGYFWLCLLGSIFSVHDSERPLKLLHWSNGSNLVN